MWFLSSNILLVSVKVCFGAYLVLLYPQYGTSLKDIFFTLALAGTLFMWYGDRARFREYKNQLLSDPLFWGMLGLAVWGLAASVVLGFSQGRIVSSLDVFRKVMVKGVITYLVVTWLYFRQRNLDFIFTVLAVVGALACLDVLFSYGLDYFSFANRDAARTFFHQKVHVNVISRKLNFLTPFLLAWVWRWGRRKGRDWCLYPALAFVLVASFFTISRAGWLGAVGGILVFLVFMRSWKTVMVSLALGVLVFLLAYAGSKDVRLHVEILKERLPSLSERLPNWKLCLKAIGAEPLWGWGVSSPETFHHMVRSLEGNKSKILKYLHPHNVFLEISLLWGLPFLLVLGGMFLYIYWKAWALAGSVGFLQGLQWGTLVGASVGCFWINGFFSEILWPFVFLVVGTSASLIPPAGK